MPPVIAGVLTGVVRAVVLFRKEDPKTLCGWRWWFATYERVPLTTIGVSIVVISWELGGGALADGLAGAMTETIFAIVVLSVAYAIAGFLFGIPIAAVVCVLIYDVWLWIDAGGDGD